MWIHIPHFEHLQFKWFCFCLSLLQAWPPKALPHQDFSFITLPLHSFPQPNPSWPHPHRPPVYPGGLFHFPFPGKSICPHPNFRPSFFYKDSLRLLVVAWISFSLQPNEILFEWKIMKNIVKLKRSLDCVTYRNILGDLTKRKFEPREIHTVRNMWRSKGEESYWSDGIHWEVPKKSYIIWIKSQRYSSLELSKELWPFLSSTSQTCEIIHLCIWSTTLETLLQLSEHTSSDQTCSSRESPRHTVLSSTGNRKSQALPHSSPYSERKFPRCRVHIVFKLLLLGFPKHTGFWNSEERNKKEKILLLGNFTWKCLVEFINNVLIMLDFYSCSSKLPLT